MAGLSLWEKFRYENQPKKRFKPSAYGDEEEDDQESNAEATSKQSDSQETRNSLDCLTKPGSMTPDSCQDSGNIHCIPETPTSLQPSPYHSPVFSGNKTKASHRPSKGQKEASHRPSKGQKEASHRPSKGQKEASHRPSKGQKDASQEATDGTCIKKIKSRTSTADTTAADNKMTVNGGDGKRGMKRRFRLMTESGDSDSDSSSKPTSPVFGQSSNDTDHTTHNGHETTHTFSKTPSTNKEDTECIIEISDADDDEPGSSLSSPVSPSPGKRRTARMGLSPSRVAADQKKNYRRISSYDDSLDDSDKTQLDDEKESIMKDLSKRFPKRSRQDLINVLIGLEWSLFDAIQTLHDAQDEEDESSMASDDENTTCDSDTPTPGGKFKLDKFAYSKSSKEDSSEWMSKEKQINRTKRSGNGWASKKDTDFLPSDESASSVEENSEEVSEESSRSSSEEDSFSRRHQQNTWRRDRDTRQQDRDVRKRQRAVAVPEEYRPSKVHGRKSAQEKSKSAKHTCHRRIKRMASSSEDEMEQPQPIVQSAGGSNSIAKEPDEVVITGEEDDDGKDDESSLRSNTPTVDDEDDDYKQEDEDTGLCEEDMPTFHKLVLSFFNDATLEELVGVEGCSKRKAQKVIKLRPFESFIDLINRLDEVRGLGQILVWNSRSIFQGREIVVFLMNKCSRIAERIRDVVSAQLDITDGDGDGKAQIVKEPSTLDPRFKLKPYQIIGLNWLALLHREGVNGILADEMGLGKTVQTIAFLAYLLEKGYNGPHVIVVPSSTLDNWARELMKWCPALEVLMYSGSQPYRAELRADILSGNTPFDVILTTYNLCASTADDRSLFKKLRIQYAIFDEGHMLKNMSSNRYQHLMKIKAKRRLLLTGTPLQNNLLELISLLSFVMPDIFMNKAPELKKIFGFHKLKNYGINTEQSTFEEERIAHARQIMQPFMLRRIKTEVLKQLPRKTERLEYINMEDEQEKSYKALKLKLSNAIKDKDNVGKSKTTGVGALMELRKMSNHPLLLRNHYNDEKLTEMAHLMLKEPTHYDANPDLIHEDMCVMSDFELHRLCHEYSILRPHRLDKELVMASGKFQKLDELLPKLKQEGSRVLLFSQFVMVLDIVEPYMKHRGYKYLRLDGSTQVSTRQEMIDKFTANEDIFIFLLSTRAGGLGINLTAANTVILHDIDYNPYNDKQAEDRCHRMGQTRDVTVIRFISKHTVEEAMLKCAQYKLKLEQRMTTNKQDEEDEGDVADMLKEALDL